MASYIQQGEKITASWLNSLVDAANGQSIHTGNYINTPNGVVYKPTNTFNNEQSQTAYLHQCRYGSKTYDLVHSTGDADVIEEANRHIYMFLGRSLPAYIASFKLPENLVVRSVEFIVESSNESGEPIYAHKSLTQADFAVNDKVTNSLSSIDMISITQSEYYSEYDYSGWVETPFNENVLPKTHLYKCGIYMHILPILTENQQEMIFNPSVVIAFANTNVLDMEKVTKLLQQNQAYSKFTFGMSEIDPILICANSIESVKIPATDTIAVQHLVQYHTGPINISGPTISELEPRFIVSKIEETEDSGVSITMTPFFDINGNVGVDESDEENLYVCSDNYTVNGVPIYFKVNKFISNDKQIVRGGSSQKILYVAAGFSKDNSSYITLPDALTINDENIYVKSFSGTSDFNFSALTPDNSFVSFGVWANPKWDKKINKWVVEFKFSKSNSSGIADVFKFPSESDSESDSTTVTLKPWLLGWCEIAVEKLTGLVPQSYIIKGDKKGSLTIINVDSQYDRREDNLTYALDDSVKNTHKSLQYVETTLGQSFDSSEAAVNDYALELYNFSDKINAECPEIEEMFTEELKESGDETVTLVCRKETRTDDALDVTIEYYNMNNLIDCLSSKLSTDTEITESDLMSGDEKLMRRKSIDRNTVTQTLDEVDENGENKTKEIDYLELYDFGITVNANCRSLNDFIKKDGEEGETSIKESFTFVTRVEKEDNDGNVDAEIEYLNIGDLSNSFVISGDSQMGEIGQFEYLRSIELCSMLDENGEETGEKYYQLYNFDDGCANLILSAEELTQKDGFVFRKYDEEKNGFEIQYADPFSISNLVPLPDVDTTFFANRNPPTQKSIELKIGCTFDSNDNDGYYYQLYNVDKPSDMEETDCKVEIEEQGLKHINGGCYLKMESLLPDQYEFVVRELGCGGCGIIHYMPLSVGVHMPPTDRDLGIDARYPAYSIQVNKKAINPDGEFLQLYNFDDYGSAQQLYPNWDDTVNGYDLLLNRGDGILVRRINGDNPQNPFPTLEYMTLGSLSNFVNYIGDADNSLEDDCGVEKTYSIEKKRDERRHQDYMQLYQFDDPSNPHNWSINLDEDGGSYYLTNDDQDYQFLVRSIKDGQPKLEYAKISIAAPVIDIPEIPDYSDWFYEIEERITVIEDTLSSVGCYWVQGGSYDTNYGSAIGNSEQTKIIDLDDRILCGCMWTVTGSLEADAVYTTHIGGINTSNVAIDLTTKTLTGSTGDSPWYTDYLNVGCILTCGILNSNTIRLGSTTLTETQLQQLLALIR